jgi:release factor glutamine methyltransferase
VSRDTLIPRPDSETLIRAALKTARRPPERVLDLGTGTGCLLLSLLQAFPGAFGIGTDRNLGAVRLARANAVRNGLVAQASFVQADWTDAIQGRFDLVVSNPPYIPAADIVGLMPEVALHEPRAALDGGTDGFDAYRAIVPRLPGLLGADGFAVLEVGAGQAGPVAAMARAVGLRAAAHLDLAAIPRAIVLETRCG